MVRPTPKGHALFGVMRTVGTHDPDLHEAEEPNNHGNIDEQRHQACGQYCGAPYKESRYADEEKVSQFRWAKVAVDTTGGRAVGAIRLLTCGNRDGWVFECYSSPRSLCCPPFLRQMRCTPSLVHRTYRDLQLAYAQSSKWSTGDLGE